MFFFRRFFKNKYLLNDTYRNNKSSGSVNNTDTDRGKRLVTDTENKTSISDGRFEISGGKTSPSWSDPLVYYRPQKRESGKILIFKGVRIGQTQNAGLGFSQSTGGDPANRQAIFYFADTGPRLFCPTGSIGPSVATWAIDTSYDLAIVLRSTGAFFFIKGGVWEEWSLLWVSSSGSTSKLYPIGESRNVTIGWDRVVIPNYFWIPSPLVSDGFSSLLLSDGLGHSEGITRGLGKGGNNLEWEDDTGDWNVSGGVAFSGSSGGGFDEIRRIDVNNINVVISIKLVWSSGDGGIIVRYTDGSNYIKLLHNGTNIKLIKVVSGSETTLINAATTYVSNAVLRLICLGTLFKVYYNNVRIDSDKTISDSILQSGTEVGIFVKDGVGNTFDDFTVFAVTSDEYEIFDTF